MKFEEQLKHLDTLLRERSTDFDEMLRTLGEIRKSRELLRYMDAAQDRLYASIASGHLKVLQHLEAGNIQKAKEEAAAAVAWFHRRFEGFQPDTSGGLPQVTQVFQSISEVSKQSATLREALKRRDVALGFSLGEISNEKPIR